MNLPKSLIHKYPQSKLSIYFENENVVRDNLGNVKVDRDPECFRFVINLIRNGNIEEWPENQDNQNVELKHLEEVAFWGPFGKQLDLSKWKSKLTNL